MNASMRSNSRPSLWPALFLLVLAALLGVWLLHSADLVWWPMIDPPHPAVTIPPEDQLPPIPGEGFSESELELDLGGAVVVEDVDVGQQPLPTPTSHGFSWPISIP